MIQATLLLFHAAFLTLPLGIDGSYVAQRMNGHELPADLRIAATEGDFRLFRLEQGVLRLSRDGRFTLYFRYYHQLVRRGGRPTATPVMSDSETGTYISQSGQLTLTPTKRKGKKARPTITATIIGEEIRASYVLDSGGTQQRVTLVMQRDARYW